MCLPYIIVRLWQFMRRPADYEVIYSDDDEEAAAWEVVSQQRHV